MANKIIKKKEAKELISKLHDNFAVINNPGYVYPDYELYSLATKILRPVPSLEAAVMDMDGTTTTTEALCIHSLEYMVRKFSGRMTKSDWKGLDPVKDYPHIIGNSTTKHIEYLIKRYRKHLSQDEIIKSFLFAAAWTVFRGKDDERMEEVRTNLKHYGCLELISDKKIRKAMNEYLNDERVKQRISEYLYRNYSSQFKNLNFSIIVKMGIDVYYQRYHQILERIRIGESDLIAEEIFGSKGIHLIETMPGIETFLSLIKGIIHSDYDVHFRNLLEAFKLKSGLEFPRNKIEQARKDFKTLCDHFNKQPMKVAIVTSSIQYEADIVLSEVFRIMYLALKRLPISRSNKMILLNSFRDYRSYYDAVITASDSSEIRLKPHRDLYSIALHRLNVPRERFSHVIGFEDSESGTIAMRAAGIGLSIAVPFAETTGHNLSAAARICKGGLPEVILKHNLFLRLK